MLVLGNFSLIFLLKDFTFLFANFVLSKWCTSKATEVASVMERLFSGGQETRFTSDLAAFCNCLKAGFCQKCSADICTQVACDIVGRDKAENELFFLFVSHIMCPQRS